MTDEADDNAMDVAARGIRRILATLQDHQKMAVLETTLASQMIEWSIINHAPFEDSVAFHISRFPRVVASIHADVVKRLAKETRQ